MLKVTQEIELRGPLDKKQYESLLKILHKKAKFIEHRERINYMFDHTDSLVDLRVRSTNDDVEMVLKTGKIGASERKEISFKLGRDSLKNALDFLYYLGYKTGMTGTRISDIFKYGSVEFAVVSVPGRGDYHTYYFEMEYLAKDGNVEKAKAHMKTLADKLSLRFFDEKEYDKYLDGMNKYGFIL